MRGEAFWTRFFDWRLRRRQNSKEATQTVRQTTRGAWRSEEVLVSRIDFSSDRTGTRRMAKARKSNGQWLILLTLCCTSSDLAVAVPLHLIQRQQLDALRISSSEIHWFQNLFCLEEVLIVGGKNFLRTSLMVGKALVPSNQRRDQSRRHTTKSDNSAAAFWALRLVSSTSFLDSSMSFPCNCIWIAIRWSL